MGDMHLFTRKFIYRLIALMFIIVGIISVGTVVFSSLEDWTPVEAAYFATATLTTVGYGDLTPSNDTSRAVAIMYMLLTVPLFILMIGVLGEAMFYRYHEIHMVRAQRKPRKKARIKSRK